MSKFGRKNSDKKGQDKKMKQQLDALARKNAARKAKKK